MTFVAYNFSALPFGVFLLGYFDFLPRATGLNFAPIDTFSVSFVVTWVLQYALTSRFVRKYPWLWDGWLVLLRTLSQIYGMGYLVLLEKFLITVLVKSPPCPCFVFQMSWGFFFWRILEGIVFLLELWSCRGSCSPQCLHALLQVSEMTLDKIVQAESSKNTCIEYERTGIVNIKVFKWIIWDESVSDNAILNSWTEICKYARNYSFFIITSSQFNFPFQNSYWTAFLSALDTISIRVCLLIRFLENYALNKISYNVEWKGTKLIFQKIWNLWIESLSFLCVAVLFISLEDKYHSFLNKI